MSADDVIWVRCQALSDDDYPCARAAGHDNQHWCVACTYSHEFDAYCDVRANGCVCSRVPGHDGPHFCGDGPGHDFGEGE